MRFKYKNEIIFRVRLRFSCNFLLYFPLNFGYWFWSHIFNKVGSKACEECLQINFDMHNLSYLESV